jgi:hypothetical protein
MSDGGDGGRKEDVVLLHSPAESGEGIRVVRKRDDSIELGELRPMREGQPIHGEVVRLTQREEHALLFDCEVVVPSQARKEAKAQAPEAEAKREEPREREPTAMQHKGPPRVTSDAYRGGWELIFGGKRRSPSEPPN